MEKIELKTKDQSLQIAKVLRFLGCCLLLAGAVSYLVEGWYEVGHITRYLKFLGITGLISATGIGTALLLKEERGARTFLMVAATAIPINFCQLGALIYSAMPFKNVPESINNYLLWEASSLGVTLLVTGIASIALSFVTYLSFSVLGKQGRTLLVPSVILLHLGLLIPVREVLPVCILAIISIIFAYNVSSKLKKLYAFEYTLEGIFCRALLFAPSALLLLRTATIYSVSNVIAGLIILYVGALFLAASRIFKTSESFLSFLEFIGVTSILTGLVVEQYALLEMIGLHNTTLTLPLISIFILIATEVLIRVCNYISDSLRAISFTAAALISGTYSLDAIHAFGMSYCLFVGIYGFILGKENQSTYINFLSALLLIIGTKLVVTEILPNLIQSWVGLSFVGIGVVLLGSFVDKGLFNKKINLNSDK